MLVSVIPGSFRSSFPEVVDNSWKWCLKTYQSDSELVQKFSYVVLNSVILATKIFTQIPSVVAGLSYSIMSYLSVASFKGKNGDFAEFKKSLKDFCLGFESKDKIEMIFTASKVAMKGCNILAVSCLFGAALATTFGFPQANPWMATNLRPLSIFSLLSDMVNRSHDYFKKRDLAKRISKIDCDGDATRIQNITRNFFSLCDYSFSSDQADTLSRNLFQQITLRNVNNWKKFEELCSRLSDEDKKKFLIDLIKKEQQDGKLDFSLVLFSYVCIVINNTWPFSFIEILAQCAYSITDLYFHIKKNPIHSGGHS